MRAIFTFQKLPMRRRVQHTWLHDLPNIRFFKRIKILPDIVLQQLTISVRHYIKPHQPIEMVTFSIHYLFYFIYLLRKKYMFFEQRGFWSLCIHNFFEVEMRSKSTARNANKSTEQQLEAWCMHRFPEKSLSPLYVRNMVAWDLQLRKRQIQSVHSY